MALDFNTLASGLTAKITAGDTIKSLQGDEGSVQFESILDQAKALQILQQVESSAARKRAVRPSFFGLQPFSNSGLCGERNSCRCK